MDKIIEEAISLRKEINELPEIKEYLRLKELYENDESLKEMRYNIAKLKSEGKEEERKNLLDLYNKHPLVNNYEIAKQEAIDVLNTIKNIIR